MMTTETSDLTRRLFDVDEFERMLAAGVFDEDDRIELIAGEIITMTPPNPPHDGVINRLTRLFTSRYGARCIVHVQNTLRLGSRSLFLPDVCLLRDRADFYGTRRAAAEDVLLAVEVADSTLRKDTRIKGPLYAEAGVVELWIVDVQGGVVHRHSDPSPDGYRACQAYRRGDSIPLPPGGGTAPIVDVIG